MSVDDTDPERNVPSSRGIRSRPRFPLRAPIPRRRLLRVLLGLALVVEAGELGGEQGVAAFLGALGLAEVAEDPPQVVQRLGVLLAVLVVDHVHPQELPPRVLELPGLEVAVAE